jgi:UDPglucose 6-dehydrogenase
MGLDKRIGDQFLNAGIGYGGSCFSKDLSALINTCKENNVNSSILKGTRKINKLQIKYIVDKIRYQMWTVKDKNIIVLGLAFKPNTDDLRNAPSIKLIKELLKYGAHIKVHDPIVGQEFKKIIPEVEIATDYHVLNYTIEEACQNTDAVVLVTEWDIYKKLNWKDIGEGMRNKILFDCRNALNPEEIRACGFEYYGVGIF